MKYLHRYLLVALVIVCALFATGTLSCRGPAAPREPAPATEPAKSAQPIAVAAAAAPSPKLALSCTLPDGTKYGTLLDGARRWAMPSGQPTPRAPDGLILGAHVVDWRVVSPDLVLVALRLSNAAANPNGTGHPGKTYFRSIEMSVDGWSVAFDVQRAPPPYLVAPPTVGDNVFLSGQAFVRRFALYRGKVTQQRALASLDSVPQLDAALPFGPCQIKLPAIDTRAQEIRFAAKLRSLRTNLAAGNADPPNDLRTRALGPFHPTGNPNAYEHGGQSIFFVWGWEQCPSAALYWRTVGDLVIERMRFVYDKTTGARITPEMWAKGAGKPFQPFSILEHGDSDSVDTEGRHTYLPPAFDVPRFNAGTCTHEPQLAAFDAHDFAHRIRAIGPWSASYALTRDAVHREAILDDANWMRMGYADNGLPPGPYRSGLPTMRSWMKVPHNGVPSLGRAYGWAMYGHAAALWVATPRDAEYRALRRNAAALLKLRADASMSNGLPQRANCGAINGVCEPKITGGGGAPKDGEFQQSFEAAIVWRGELALGNWIELPRENLDAIRTGATNLYDGAFATRPVPPKYVTVAKAGGAPLAKLSEGFNVNDTPYGDASHVDAMLAALYAETGEHRWLEILCRGKSRDDAASAYLQRANGNDSPAWFVEAASVLARASTDEQAEAHHAPESGSKR